MFLYLFVSGNLIAEEEREPTEASCCRSWRDAESACDVEACDSFRFLVFG